MGCLLFLVLLFFDIVWGDTCTGPAPAGYTKNYETDKYWHKSLANKESYASIKATCENSQGFIPRMVGTKQMSLEVKADIRKCEKHMINSS